MASLPVLRRAARGASTWFVAAALLLALGGPGPASAQQGFTATRASQVNGRQVLEVRMGIVPRTSILRTLVITAGPVAGSTSLLVNTSFVGDLFNASVPMTFSVVVNSGGLFSLGGGCARAGELNFPYIDNLRFNIVRYTGTTQTIVTPPAISTGQYEGVNCTTSANGQAVFYALLNRNTGRLEVWRELAGNVFARIYQSSSAVRLPFNGGYRPQITRMRRLSVPGAKGDPVAVYESGHFLAAFQTSSGQTQVVVVNESTGAEEGLCPIGTRTAGTPPFEGALVPGYVVGDFDGNGVAEIVSIRPSIGGLCEAGTRRVPIGSANGGNGFAWTGYALSGDAGSEAYRVLNGASNVRLLPSAITGTVSPFFGRGGPFHGAFVERAEFEAGTLVAGTGSSNLDVEFFADLPAFADGVRVASFEDPVTGELITIETAPPP
jgi:hypothetical protein